VVTALMVLPYLDRKRKGVGVWFSRERKVATTIFSICLATFIVLTLIGTFFRGPNWSFHLPWKPAQTEQLALP
jgi:quinol-cytochrome oxidoreductase complex cytochrome b subunit